MTIEMASDINKLFITDIDFHIVPSYRVLLNEEEVLLKLNEEQYQSHGYICCIADKNIIENFNDKFSMRFFYHKRYNHEKDVEFYKYFLIIKNKECTEFVYIEQKYNEERKKNILKNMLMTLSKYETCTTCLNTIVNKECKNNPYIFAETLKGMFSDNYYYKYNANNLVCFLKILKEIDNLQIIYPYYLNILKMLKNDENVVIQDLIIKIIECHDFYCETFEFLKKFKEKIKNNFLKEYAIGVLFDLEKKSKE